VRALSNPNDDPRAADAEDFQAFVRSQGTHLYRTACPLAGSYDGGTLISDTSRAPLSDGSLGPLSQDFWLSPDGYEVGLSIADSDQADLALTQQQMFSVLTDPAWRTITGELPSSTSAGN
jgi:hypothetical protein